VLLLRLQPLPLLSLLLQMTPLQLLLLLP